MTHDISTNFAAARRAGAPLVAIRTADVAATIETIAPLVATLNKSKAESPLLQWDAARGLIGLNKPGNNELARGEFKNVETIGFVEAMLAIQMLNEKAIVFVLHAHRQLVSQEPGATATAMQAVANLRDTFKRNFRMAVFIGPVWTSPLELQHDVVVLNHGLPNADALGKIVTSLHNDASLPQPKDLAKAVDALVGLSAFAAEQDTAMSLTPTGADVDMMWERKRTMIEETPGLSVWRGKERFVDIIGQEALKEKLLQRIKGRRPLGVVVWIDEIDKALANVEHDTSGVRTYQLQRLLTEMENNRWGGFVGCGVAGGGKSLAAKAIGNEADVPTIALDLGATESKYVGESEANLNRVIDIIKAIGDGHAYFVATSNAATIMRPELQRRFFDGFWMFDLMSEAERAASWTYYIKKYDLDAKQPLPKDENWTGAEIRNCCEAAYDCRVSLVDAARFIVPMAWSRADEVERLRIYAHGRFLDVSNGGTYRYDQKVMEAARRAVMVPAATTLQ